MATTKRIIPGVFDELVEVDVYQDKHRPEQQEKVGQGYPLNPVLRDNFCNTPNEHREPLEHEDWWDLPYIESTTWQQSEASIRLAQQARGDELSTMEAEARIETLKASFFAFNPGGTKYTVHCLDGGAWDRPTMWGVFPALEEAIECCTNGPAWRKNRA